MIDTFYANLIPLADASEHSGTMEFWRKNPVAWATVIKDREYPNVVMNKYYSWVKALPGLAVFMGFPVTFDFGFVHWYFWKFCGDDPFSFARLGYKNNGHVCNEM